jgi:2-polyprenyl-6-methoxyphenol hydroxylase-like FAD-dependent oxidoreductase
VTAVSGHGRVVVLGGSMAGLLAARVLSEKYEQVIVVDRDKLSGVEGYRRGVPHGRHAHGLVARGQQVLEELFPGLRAELEDFGVQPGDLSSTIHWIFNGRRLAPAETGLISVPATRPVLEFHVRRRVQGRANVTFLEETDILGLETTPDNRRVIGARVQRRAEGSPEEVLTADLVIDITGKGSRTPVWLTELGYPRPAEERVKVGLAYTTRHYRLPADPFGSDIAIIPVPTPSHPRGAFFYRLPGPGNRIELSVTGLVGDHPPNDPEGFGEFVRSLPVPYIYECVRDAEPLDDPVTFRYPASVRRHYEKLTRFPEGFLVMGDAVCSFNPTYGQGMTVAALEALALRDHLRDRSEPVARRFFQEISKVIDAPWDISAGGDLAFPGVEGRRTLKIRLINAYLGRFQRAAVHDPALTEAFMRVAGLIDPPPALMSPRNLIRVLRHGGKKKQPPVPAQPPAALPGQPTDLVA